MFSKLFGKKKYPHNKKVGPAVGVYAGPEYFEKQRKQREEAEVLDVYAGPGFFNELPGEPEDGEDCSAVYAGPEEGIPPKPEGRIRARSGGRVYAGPEPGARPKPGAGPEPDTEPEEE